MIRVLIVDDQALVRAGVRGILDAADDLQVVGEAEDGLGAVAAAERLAPDVVLMDIRMPNVDGLEATRRILAGAAAPPRILVLTMFRADDHVFAALRAGASGFLLKDARAEDLIEAVRQVARGESLLDPQVTRAVVERFAALPAPDPEQLDRLRELTARECEVLVLLVRGRSNREIAAELVVSEATVKTHVLAVLRKLGLRDRVQAVIFGYETGLAYE